MSELGRPAILLGNFDNSARAGCACSMCGVICLFSVCLGRWGYFSLYYLPFSGTRLDVCGNTVSKSSLKQLLSSKLSTFLSKKKKKDLNISLKGLSNTRITAVCLASLSTWYMYET